MKFSSRFTLSALPALTVAILALPFLAQAQGPEQTQPTQPVTTKPTLNGTMHAPIQAGGAVALDLPDSSAQAITLDILKGRFADYSVGRITLTGSGMDFRNGTLAGLKADIAQGNFDNLLVDHFLLTAPGFSFDTMQLLNNRTFVLSEPVTASVNLSISEEGLNRFLANPKTMGKIEKAIQKQTGGLKLVTFSNPSLALVGGNKVKVNVTGIIAQGLAVPLEMTGHLGLSNGQLVMQDLAVASGGNDLQLPLDVAKSFQDKINEMIDFKKLGKSSMIITADKLKFAGKTLQIEGHATLTRLQFG